MKQILPQLLIFFGLIIALSILLCSCGSGKFEDIRKKSDIEFIAEKDSVKVYRIINDGSVIYFTNKGCVTMP